MQRALPLVAPERRRSLLEAVGELAARVGGASPVAAACLRFQGALLARPETLFPDPSTGLALIDEAQAAAWLKVGGVKPGHYNHLSLVHACDGTSRRKDNRKW